MAVTETPLDPLPHLRVMHWCLWATPCLLLLPDPFCVKPEPWELKSLHLLANLQKLIETLACQMRRRKIADTLYMSI